MSFETDMAAAYEQQPDAAQTKTELAADQPGTEVTTTEAGEEQPKGQQGENSGEEHADENTERRPAGEKDAKQAAQRREREAQAKIQAAVQQQMDAFYAKQYAGKTGKDGQKIATQAQAEAYEREQVGAADVKTFTDLGMDETSAKRMANMMARLNQLEEAETARKKVAEAQQQLDEQAAIDKMFADNLAALNKAFPGCGISSVEELVGGQHNDLCNLAAKLDGNLVDAYYLLHKDDIMSGKTAAARQQAINAARGSTEHLHGIKATSGNAESELTEEDYKMWANFGYSRDQARAAHKKFK